MSTETCRDCGWGLRPAGQAMNGQPGTRPKGRAGQCKACYSRQYRNEHQGEIKEKRRLRYVQNERSAAALPKTSSHDFDVTHARYTLESWISNLPSRKARA